MAYLAQVSYTGDGSTVGYSLPFTYIATTHIKAYIAGVETSAFTVSGSTVTFTSPPANAAVIKIERVTPTDARLVDFQDGSVLTESDLDQSADQNFYIAQESSDLAQAHLALDASLLWDATSKRIINVANPTGNQDAATKHYLENTWLSTADKANLTAVGAVTSQIALLGTSDAIADMNTIGSADFVSDLNTVASADFVADLNVLATADVVTDMNTLGTSANVTNMATVADNLAGVTSFAERYRVGSSNPASSLDEGDLFFNTSDNALKYYNGSSWASITAGIGSLADDTTPQLGGTLDLNGQVIDFKPQYPVSNINSVGANTTTTLVSTRNYMLAGVITVADTYTWDVAGTGTLTIV